MANELCASLRLVDKDLSGKLVQVVEQHGADASFVLGSLMWNASRSNTSLFLLALNNSLDHYHNVAKKLGFNLKTAIDNKTAVVLEPVNAYLEKFSKSEDKSKESVTLESFFGLDAAPCLFDQVKSGVAATTGKKCLVIDDLSSLLHMGVRVEHVAMFLQKCRDLLRADTDLYLVVGTHVADHCEHPRIVADFASHHADLRVTVAPLRTGFSANVTGTMEVVDKLDRATGAAVVGVNRVHHFKLTDRQIKVFAPGTVGIY